VRQLESWFATKLAQFALRVRLRDPMSGFFMLRRSDFLRVRKRLSNSGFKILLELAARLNPRDVREVPYTFRARVAGQSKLSAGVVLAFIRQFWRLSAIGRLLPGELIKFGLVGTVGVVVNLTALSSIFHLTAYRDWRASAMATFAAMINNYFLNNFWTFADRSHRGLRLIGKSFSFLLISCAGLAITTFAYAVISAAERRILNVPVHPPEWALLLAQLIAILAGTCSNYSLNRVYTWPQLRTKPPLEVVAPSEAICETTEIDN
jgi:dolichol-phosphate mannosyltransferase